MVLKTKIVTLLRQNWLSFVIIVVMLLNGLYLLFFMLTGYHYWLIFPYSDDNSAALTAGLLFVVCIGVLIVRSSQSNVLLKIPLAISWPILLTLGFLILSGLVLSFVSIGEVEKLDRAVYKDHIIHLAYRSLYESGFRYYLFDCDRYTLKCDLVADFNPYNPIVSQNPKSARLNITPSGLVTVVYNEQVLYEYSSPTY